MVCVNVMRIRVIKLANQDKNQTIIKYLTWSSTHHRLHSWERPAPLVWRIHTHEQCQQIHRCQSCRATGCHIGSTLLSRSHRFCSIKNSSKLNGTYVNASYVLLIFLSKHEVSLSSDLRTTHTSSHSSRSHILRKVVSDITNQWFFVFILEANALSKTCNCSTEHRCTCRCLCILNKDGFLSDGVDLREQGLDFVN